MNICYLTWEYPPELNGGVAVYIYEIAQAIKNLGHNVFVVTKTEKEEREDYEDGIYVIRLNPKRYKFFNLCRNYIPRSVTRLEFSLQVAKRLKKLIRDNKIDIIESAEAYSIGFIYYLFRKSPPLIIKLHTPEAIIFKWNERKLDLDIKLLSRMEELWILKARKLIAITHSMKCLLSRFYKINTAKFPVLRNPFTMPDRLDLTNKEEIILCIGRLEFRKGQHILIQALPYVLKEFPDIKFIFIGSDCGMKWYLEKKIKEYNCSQNVNFYEYLPRQEIFNYYLKARACIIPSLWENFSYVMLEAMALSCPVIASDCGGFSEVIKDGYNGFLFKPGSFLELKEKISQLLKDEDKTNFIIKNAHCTVQELTQPEKIAKNTLKIYAQAIQD